MTTRLHRFVGVLTLCAVTLCLVRCTTLMGDDNGGIHPASTLPETTPWDLKALSDAPDYMWLEAEGQVRSLLYEGTPFEGKSTSVFAYFASPETLSGESVPKHGFPTVVLVHGGGGKAFKEWVRLWAERGYAAIAMDLAGCGEGGERLANGGPGQGDDTKFGKIDELVTEQWTYHAVANVILAHSLVRSFPEVDAERTAITGISWGGYLTCIVSGLDNRFKASVPVYGCGYLHERSVWLPQFEQMTPEQRTKWVQLWDPSRYIGSANMPVFFVNGTNDFAYWLESYAKTYDAVRRNRNLRITVNMPHGHEVGWAPQEIGLFIDQHLIGGTPLPLLGKPVLTATEVLAGIDAETRIKSASLYYSMDKGENKDRAWETVPAAVQGKTIHAPRPPANTTICFLTVTDERDAVVSSSLSFMD